MRAVVPVCDSCAISPAQGRAGTSGRLPIGQPLHRCWTEGHQQRSRAAVWHQTAGKGAAVAGTATKRRNLVIAVDSTDDAQQAVQWVVDNLIPIGVNTLHLLHVISDQRTPATAVGASSAGAQWSTSDFQQRNEYFQQLESAAQAMIEQRFAPVLRGSSVSYEVHLLRERSTKSAAGIGELICERSASLSADIMVIASHGTGVLAEYGSVAKYCQQHARSAVLMIPPRIADLDFPQPGTLLVVALDDLPGLERAVRFAGSHLYRAGDRVSVIFVEDTVPVSAPERQSGESAQQAAPEAVQRLQAAAEGALAKAVGSRVPVEVDIIRPSAPLATVEEFDVGEEICAAADEVQARTLVLLHHGKTMMAEMVFGSATNYCVRNCRRPLAVVE